MESLLFPEFQKKDVAEEFKCFNGHSPKTETNEAEFSIYANTNRCLYSMIKLVSIMTFV